MGRLLDVVDRFAVSVQGLKLPSRSALRICRVNLAALDGEALLTSRSMVYSSRLRVLKRHLNYYGYERSGVAGSVSPGVDQPGNRRSSTAIIPAAARRRVRQHVNPLSLRFNAAPEVPNVSEVWTNPALPVHIDLGTGFGELPLTLAADRRRACEVEGTQAFNFVGVEIRAPAVEEAQAAAMRHGVDGSTLFLLGTAEACVPAVSNALPDGRAQIRRISVLHPDPHFKRRHRKRRYVSCSSHVIRNAG